MARFQELLRAANNLRLLAAIGRSGGELASVADLIPSLGYDPEFFRPRDGSSEGHWLTQRIATTHDIHHVITGFGTAPQGENSVLAITATQIGFPGTCCSPQPGSWLRSASSPKASPTSAPPWPTAMPSPARPSAWPP